MGAWEARGFAACCILGLFLAVRPGGQNQKDGHASPISLLLPLSASWPMSPHPRARQRTFRRSAYLATSPVSCATLGARWRGAEGEEAREKTLLKSIKDNAQFAIK